MQNRRWVKIKNNTEVFGEGYRAGYNQALVDKEFMTQERADELLRAGISCPG